MIYILLLLNIIFLVLGQTLWKIGLSGINFKFTVNGIIKIIISPYILGGLAIYSIATILWLYILSRTELSLVYPLQSLCYVAAALIAFLIFKESIPITRWFGIGLIVLGACLVSVK
ncbi:EamA family transporter [Clostridium oryzae]|uniref:4-amino-4-deoxy-L-arabinose-phosphoundecaprenol flippase subunit ArnE n=1 Tax=Clostridium oryzae TaxID=1450648 RepID=A0A1V4IIA1_9CLOT|nr:EamA family transporter [Clostridium oryzae]OPJ59227.1 4-amino-4-deoxy-L-arabinose-phosphoundecaprenol flippase subunit ArnE [Clostridium oryzae]